MVTKNVVDLLSQQYFRFGNDGTGIDLDGCAGGAFDFHDHIHTVLGLAVIGAKV